MSTIEHFLALSLIPMVLWLAFQAGRLHGKMQINEEIDKRLSEQDERLKILQSKLDNVEIEMITPRAYRE